MTTLERVEDELQRVVDQAKQHGILLRVLGGLAVKLHCPSAGHRALERDYPDIDFVTDRQGAQRLAGLLPALGYVPNKTFNTLSGDRRQLYYDEPRGRQIDVFIGEFDMCHKLPLASRLDVEPLTVPLAELFLSKAQIVQLNRKDVLDLIALLLDHPVADGDWETINRAVIAGVCGRDWGLFTTVALTLGSLRDVLARGEVGLDDGQHRIVFDRMATIRSAMETAPKTAGWKMRARVGRRVRWYQEVEEVRR
jgi:hypothetical protein